MSERLLTVIEPGLLTTVQDLGRTGLMRFGVTTGGALDQAALILGNRLVGNAPDAAGLEITLLGPRLRFTGPTVLALTGADLGATLNGVAVPLWTPILAGAGDELAFVPSGSNGAAARAYLCLAGGIAVEPVMGSRSTDLFGRFGGIAGRALQADDRLAAGPTSVPSAELLRRRLLSSPPRYERTEPVRVVLGPQMGRFTDLALEVFLSEPYTVSPKADRMGLRLEGSPIAHTRGADLISEGIHQGAIQVPGDGRPIALTRARQTVGGYPKIATIIGADLDHLGQRRPGDRLRFTAVDVATARGLTLAYLAALGPDAVTTEPSVTAGWSPPIPDESPADGKERADVSNSWSPAAVARLIAAIQAADVSYLRLEIADAGLKLELRRGPSGAINPDAEFSQPSSEPPASESPIVSSETEIVAPMLGVFYRRPAPDQPPFAEENQPVEAGQPIGLIEVMKTYHEVTAPKGGVLRAFLVEDGQFVEYGQPIARITPS